MLQDLAPETTRDATIHKTGYVLVQIAPGAAGAAAQQISLLPGLARMDWVHGPYDAVIVAEDAADLPHLTAALCELECVHRALACMPASA